MKKMVIIALLMVGLLFIAGCSSSSTGAVPRAPTPSGAVPVGGGCGVAAPADGVSSVASAAADAL